MTKQEAIDYLERVIENWGNWCNHHERLVEAIEVLLEAVTEDDNS